MNKAEFLALLDRRLAALQESDRKRSVNYFSEMIDDRMEEGESEEEAVAGLENLDDIVERILGEAINVNEGAEAFGATAPAMPPKKARRFPLWLTILLLVLGSPIWLPLFLTLISVGATLYLCLWTILACLYVAAVTLVFVGFAGCAIAVPTAALYGTASAVFVVGCTLGGAGLGILLFFPATWFAKWLVAFTKWCCVKIGELFTGRGVRK